MSSRLRKIGSVGSLKQYNKYDLTIHIFKNQTRTDLNFAMETIDLNKHLLFAPSTLSVLGPSMSGIIYIYIYIILQNCIYVS